MPPSNESWKEREMVAQLERAPDLGAHRRLFTVEELLRMDAAGVLDPDERVELLDGELIRMAPIGTRHAAVVMWLNRRLTFALERALVNPQNSIRLGERSLPQPDITLLRYREDCYVTAHPRPEDVLLLIEVADSTVRLDRTIKGPHYGRSGISEFWLVDLQGDVLEVHRDPHPRQGYREVTRLVRGGTVRPLAFPELELAVGDVLGPAPVADPVDSPAAGD